jgi:hypothetical protein
MVVDSGLTVIEDPSPRDAILLIPSLLIPSVLLVAAEPQSMPLQATSKTSDNNTRLGSKVDLIRVSADI